MISLYLLIVVTAIYTGIGIAVCICLIRYSNEIGYDVLIPVAVIFCTLTGLVCFLFFYLIKQICTQSFDPPLRDQASAPPPPPKPPSPFPPLIVQHPGGEVVVAIYEDKPSPPQ